MCNEKISVQVLEVALFTCVCRITIYDIWLMDVDGCIILCHMEIGFVTLCCPYAYHKHIVW